MLQQLIEHLKTSWSMSQPIYLCRHIIPKIMTAEHVASLANLFYSQHKFDNPPVPSADAAADANDWGQMSTDAPVNHS